MKISKTGIEARDAVIRGANYLADAVVSTLGPGGKNALLEKKLRVTNDGKSIASEMELKDEFENLGLRKLREATEKTNAQAGDGTTSATCLAQAIVKACLPYLEKQGAIGAKKTVMEIVNQIRAEKDDIIARLSALAKPVTTEAELIDAATISVEDKDLGEMIGKAQYELGPDGMLIAEEVNARTNSVERVNGIVVDNGFGTSLVMNNLEKECLELDGVSVLLTNHTIQTLQPVFELFKQMATTGNNKVVFFARAFSNEAIAQCMNNTKQGFNIFPINAPYTDQVEVMKDLEAVLGGTFVNVESHELSDVQLSDLGFAEKIVAKRFETIVTGAKNELSASRVAKRADERRRQYEGSQSDFERGTLKTKIAQLTNGFAYVKVGGVSEVERGYKFDKVEDACNAVRHAYQEGVVPGAGRALKQIADELPDTYILKRAICAPYEKILSTLPADFAIGDDVVDPVKVVRICLENACSVASTLATIGIVIANERPKKIDELLGNKE